MTALSQGIKRKLSLLQLADELGNVLALTNSAGQLAEKYTYGPYGAPSFFDGAGAPLTPLSNAIVLDLFPRRYTGLVSAIYGMTAVVLGPVIGPTVGGMLAEAYSWRYAFYMIVPAGMAAWVALYFVMPKDEPGAAVRLDWTGFASLSVDIGALQLVFDRGEQAGWFGSTEIVVELLIAIAGWSVWRSPIIG